MQRVVSLVVVAVLAVAASACKQGEGEYCQIDDDCAGGLVCNQGTNVCQASGSGGIDAAIDAAIDASDTDAADIDALDIDAPAIDAAVDAGGGGPG